MVWVLSGGYAYHKNKMCGMIGRRNRPSLVELHESRLEDYDYDPCWRCAREIEPAAPIQENVTKLPEVGPGEHDQSFFDTRRKGYFNEHMKFVIDDKVRVETDGLIGVITKASGLKKTVKDSHQEYYYWLDYWPESDPTDVSSGNFLESQLEPRDE